MKLLILAVRLLPLFSSSLIPHTPLACHCSFFFSPWDKITKVSFCLWRDTLSQPVSSKASSSPCCHPTLLFRLFILHPKSQTLKVLISVLQLFSLTQPYFSPSPPIFFPNHYGTSVFLSSTTCSSLCQYPSHTVWNSVTGIILLPPSCSLSLSPTRDEKDSFCSICHQPVCIMLVTPQALLPLLCLHSPSSIPTIIRSVTHHPSPPSLTIAPCFHYSFLLCVLYPSAPHQPGPCHDELQRRISGPIVNASNWVQLDLHIIGQKVQILNILSGICQALLPLAICFLLFVF